MIEVRWDIPEGLDTDKYSKTRILRSMTEQYGHLGVGEIDTKEGGEPVLRFVDPTGEPQHFYMIRFYDPETDKEYLDFMLGYSPMTPRERRLINYILGWVPDVMKPDLTEGDLATSLKLALNAFNVQGPETHFTYDNFPSNYEQFLIQGTMINIDMLKYLKLAIRDFGYSDMGLNLNLDRGSKIHQSLEDLDARYKERMAMAKLNFTHQGLGLGTVPLPISMGGKIGNALNVLDLFTAMGR
jgi:hypothetical protein